MSLNRFDKIYYINLSHRQDRRDRIENQLIKLNVRSEKIVRINAVHNLLNGHKGCAMSHIFALQQAKNAKLKNVLILEDDMEFVEERDQIDSYIEAFFKTWESNWDVFFLATNVFQYDPTPYSNFKRVKKSLCAHAYAVNSHYLEHLESCFEKANSSMKDDELFMDTKYKAIDRAWHALQETDRWYIGVNPIGRQGKSYSDIEHKIRDRSHQSFLE